VHAARSHLSLQKDKKPTQFARLIFLLQAPDEKTTKVADFFFLLS
jgi:hypothetical protein